MAIGAGYGFLESAAAKDKDALLNKIPRPVAQLGYTGGSALATYLLNMVFPHPMLRKATRVLSNVASYQMGRAGGLLKSADAPAGISGPSHEALLDDESIGELVDEHVGALSPDGGTGE